MHSFSSLEKSNDSHGALLVPIILGNLPTDTKKNIARDYENREWTISDLQGAILKEIHILELDIQSTNTLTSQPPDIPTALFVTTMTRRRNHTEGVKKYYISKNSVSHINSALLFSTLYNSSYKHTSNRKC